MKDLIVIDSKTFKLRIALALFVLIVLTSGFLAIRWQVGDMLATLTQSSDPNAQEIADLATRWAPADPAAYSLKASIAEDTVYSIRLLEEAVRRSPHDFRWRTHLGRAYEQDGQKERALEELRKAVDLAPSHSFARWHLGNFYLRQERDKDAIAELKIAAENNPTYRDQVFSLAWDYYGKDALQVENFAGEREDLRARLAYFFAARGRAADSLRNWNRLSRDGKEANGDLARDIALGLFDQKHFSQALEFLKQIGADPDARQEAVTDGSFEKNIGGSDDSRFGWQIVRNDPKFEASTDTKVKFDGNQSLRVTFKSFLKPTLANIFQTVVVEPGRKYRLSFRVRTENLKSAGGPMIEIQDASSNDTLARTPPLPTGTVDWQQMSLDFTAPEKSSGISIRTIRAACGEECPISGIFWYDDFELVRQ